MRIDLTILAPYVGFLAEGALLTAEVCALALAGSVVLGMLVAIARTSQVRWVRWLAFAFVLAVATFFWFLRKENERRSE